jgi:hypothetical protein
MVLANTILIWPFNLGRWMQIERTEKKKSGEAHWRGRKSGEGILELDDGESPVVGDGDGVADVMQKRMASSNLWSMAAMASRGDVEG